MSTVAQIRTILEAAYPPSLAESWDTVGLVCGDPADEVRRVAFALDCTQAVAEEAVRIGAQMLVVHHPLLMRGVTSVAADTPKGKVIHTLIKGGVALFSAHTNADSARPGVNDRLAELVGITPGRPILPKSGAAVDKWGVHVPPADAEALKAALFDAGAGGIGNYRAAPSTSRAPASSRPSRAPTPPTARSGCRTGRLSCGSSSSPPLRDAAPSSTPCAPPTPTRSRPSTSSRWPTPRIPPWPRVWVESVSCLNR